MGHIEKSWESFTAAVENPAAARRHWFAKAAFYAGAATVFEALSDLNDPVNIPRNLDLMLAEIRRFCGEGETHG